MEKEYVKLTPKMTSNTTPSGRCFDSSNAGSYYLPYFAFDERNDYDRNTWATVNALPQWIGYQFPKPVRVRRLITVNRNEDLAQYMHNNRAVSAFTLQASNDGQNWINIGKFTSSNRTGHYKNTYDFNNNYKFFYYRLYITGNFNNASGTGCGFAEIGMYDTVDIDEAGDIEAIADWFKGTRYSKKYVDNFFILGNSCSPYVITFNGVPNTDITIQGNTSGESYTFTVSNAGQIKKLLWFESGEDVTVFSVLPSKVITLTSNYMTISVLPDVYINGMFPNSPSTTGIDNQVGPFKWSNTTQRNQLLAPYLGTDKIILEGYNCDANYALALTSNNEMTQNKTSGYGPNNEIMIPVNSIVNPKKLKFIVYRSATTRVYFRVTDVDLSHAKSTAVIIPSGTPTEYELDLSDFTATISYVYFLTEQGCPIIPRIWFEF